MDKWFKDILPDKYPYHNRGKDQMRKKGVRNSSACGQNWMFSFRFQITLKINKIINEINGKEKKYIFGFLTIKPSDYRTFGLLDLRTIGPSDYWTFGLSYRHRIQHQHSFRVQLMDIKDRQWLQTWIFILSRNLEYFIVFINRLHLMFYFQVQKITCMQSGVIFSIQNL